eukprot:scaffold117575_cov32-Tisochrysis_lutea.AAC.3
MSASDGSLESLWACMRTLSTTLYQRLFRAMDRTKNAHTTSTRATGNNSLRMPQGMGWESRANARPSMLKASGNQYGCHGS